MNIGPSELILILVIALLFFGPSKLPSLGKSLGEAIRGFKKGINDDGSDDAKNVTQISENSNARNVNSETVKTKETDKNNT